MAQRCLEWHLTLLGKCQLNSLADMSDALSCTKEKRWKRPANKMFERDFWVAQRLRNGVVFSAGT